MFTSDLMKTIVYAVRNRRVLLVDYYCPRGFRRVEPHACGVNQRGNEVVRAFQVSGPSRSGEPRRHWKMMRLDRIRDLVVLEETFQQARPGYSSGDDHMTTILAELASA